MKCINFDERFADFTAKWMKEHRGEYKTYDEMEDDPCYDEPLCGSGYRWW